MLTRADLTYFGERETCLGDNDDRRYSVKDRDSRFG